MDCIINFWKVQQSLMISLYFYIVDVMIYFSYRLSLAPRHEGYAWSLFENSLQSGKACRLGGEINGNAVMGEGK